jgi:hypothetical protein
MEFKPETIRLFIGMFVSAGGILLFNFMQIVAKSHKLTLDFSWNNFESLFSITSSLFLFIISILLLINLSKKGG